MFFFENNDFFQNFTTKGCERCLQANRWPVKEESLDNLISKSSNRFRQKLETDPNRWHSENFSNITPSPLLSVNEEIWKEPDGFFLQYRLIKITQNLSQFQQLGGFYIVAIKQE